MSHSRPRILTPLTTIALLLFSISTPADTAYYHHIFFDNSLTSDAYFYSSGKVSEPEHPGPANGKIPIDTKFSYTPPNALHLEWKSAEAGGWDARIDVIRFRNREINFRRLKPLSLVLFAGRNSRDSAAPPPNRRHQRTIFRPAETPGIRR